MADKKKYACTIAQQRRIQYYPRPTYEALVKAYAAETGESRSAVVEMGVKLFFDTMPQERKQALLRQAKNKF